MYSRIPPCVQHPRSSRRPVAVLSGISGRRPSHTLYMTVATGAPADARVRAAGVLSRLARDDCVGVAVAGPPPPAAVRLSALTLVFVVVLPQKQRTAQTCGKTTTRKNNRVDSESALPPL